MSASDTVDITHGRVLKVAFPIVLSNATVPILGAVDTGVVGQMGTAAPIGAVGLGAIILSAVYWIFGFLRMGTVGLTAQAVGEGDRREVSALLTRALIIGAGAGLVLILLQPLVFRGALLIAPASGEVEDLTRDYLAIRIWSAPAAIAIYGITGWLIAQERTRAVLVIQLWMNGLNVVLDFWFVLGLGWGVAGVAWGTFAAEWSGLVVGLWFCADAFARRAWRDWAQVFNPERLQRMLSVSGDIVVRSLFLQAIFVSFLLVSARFGDVVLAANQVMMQFLTLTAYVLDGFAFAAEALVGQALGARRRGQLRRAALVPTQWAVALVAVISAAIAMFGGMLIDLLTTSPEVRAAARGFLIYAVLSPLLSVWCFMLDGIFIGATRSRDMRNMMVLSFAIYAAAALALVPVFGAHGLWGALLVSFAARGLTLGARYPALETEAERN